MAEIGTTVRDAKALRLFCGQWHRAAVARPVPRAERPIDQPTLDALKALAETAA